MKTNEVPDKIYLFENPIDGTPDYRWLSKRSCSDDAEYTRTDAFIEKVCQFLKSYRQETPDGMGYIAGIVNDETINEFRKYMEEQQ